MSTCRMYFRFVRYNIPRLQQKVVMLETFRGFDLGHAGGDLQVTDPEWLACSVPKDKVQEFIRCGTRFGKGEFVVPDADLRRP